jgi:hypothetical protein
MMREEVGITFAIKRPFLDPFSKSPALQSVLDACGPNLDPKVKKELESLGRQWCHWSDHLELTNQRIERLSRDLRDAQAYRSKVAGTLVEIEARAELLRRVSFVVERYSEAAAGDQPTPLCFRVKADFGPR